MKVEDHQVGGSTGLMWFVRASALARFAAVMLLVSAFPLCTPFVLCQKRQSALTSTLVCPVNERVASDIRVPELSSHVVSDVLSLSKLARTLVVSCSMQGRTRESPWSHV